MDGVCHVVAYAEDGTESVGAGTEVRYRAHEFHCLALLLQRVGVVAFAKYFDGCSLYFNTLTTAD
jgi:hypothetical protein